MACKPNHKTLTCRYYLPLVLTPFRPMLSVGRSSVGSRLADYGTALKLWLGHPAVNHVIFCDNSGYDLSEIRNIVDKYNPLHKTVEFLSFNANSYPGAWGKDMENF